MRRIGWLAALALLPGCAGARFPSASVTPEEIPRLEQLSRERPDDAAVRVRLGVAYDKAGQAELARTTLEEAVKLPEAPAAAWAYLGAIAERQQDYLAAEQAYARYVELGGRAARDAAAARLAYVRRQRMIQEAKLALAREAELSATPPDPAAVAVLPLVVEGPEEYQPLGRGLAEMLATDLSLSSRLRILERARLQALLDEMRLSLAGYTDPEAGARTGRLLGAGRVVQGRVTVPEEGETQLRAVLLNSAQPEDVRETGSRGPLEALLQLELRLALAMYRELGVELTQAELARLQDRPTVNLQAFLEYSRGLEAMDRGNFAEAAQRFRQAIEIDPNFQPAADKAAEAEELSEAAEAPLEVVAEAAATEAAEATSEAPPAGDPVEQSQEAAAQSTAPAGPTVVTPTATGQTPGTGSQTQTTGGQVGNQPPSSTTGEGVRRTRQVPVIVVRPTPARAPGRQP